MDNNSPKLLIVSCDQKMTKQWRQSLGNLIQTKNKQTKNQPQEKCHDDLGTIILTSNMTQQSTTLVAITM